MCSHFLRLSVSLAESLLLRFKKNNSHTSIDPLKCLSWLLKPFCPLSLVTHTGNLSARPGSHGNTDFMWNELSGTERGHSQRPGCQKLCVSAIWPHVLTLFTIIHLLPSIQLHHVLHLCYWLFKRNVHCNYCDDEWLAGFFYILNIRLSVKGDI